MSDERCPKCGAGMVVPDPWEDWQPFCGLHSLVPWACDAIADLRNDIKEVQRKLDKAKAQRDEARLEVSYRDALIDKMRPVVEAAKQFCNMEPLSPRKQPGHRVGLHRSVDRWLRKKRA